MLQEIVFLVAAKCDMPDMCAPQDSKYVQDLSRLGRDLRRCVLVDDTPLAFLAQPDNGIPIFNFRGDVDDRVLVEVRLDPCAGAVRPSAPLGGCLHMPISVRLNQTLTAWVHSSDADRCRVCHLMTVP